MQRILPIGVLFAAVLWLSNAAYLYLSVSFIQMLKASMPVAVFTVGVMLGTTAYSHTTAANMVVIGAGTALASYGEVHFVWLGVALQLGSVVCESFRLVLIQVWTFFLHCR
jgi:Kef-type K+ transport system membrane component KefB